jgi:acetyl-CoA synthetase
MTLYEKYVGKPRDEFSTLWDLQKSFKVNIDGDFNFAYDVLDLLGTEQPDKLAMLWVGNDGEERRFTFGDMKRLSDKTANYLAGLGIKKGDMVMLVLKRGYQFWYTLLALHKIGAVAVP